MRHTNFKRAILRPMAAHLGIDYASDDFSNSHVEGWMEFINLRVEEAWETLDLPELRTTEERAFATIWNSAAEFLRSNASGAPDLFLYLPTMSYFQVRTDAPEDPPAGTLPTDTTYFAPAAIVEPLIDLDQRGRHPIGQVLGVFKSRPRFYNAAWQGMPYRLGERGLEVAPTALPSVWVRYKIKPSRFTAEEWSGDNVYSKGDLVYSLETGDCYRALIDNDGILPTQADTWALMPVPEALASFVALAAASDAAEDVALAQRLEARAQATLTRKFDAVALQTEPTRYRPFRRRCQPIGCWCETLCLVLPAGETVTTLTDVWLLDDGTADPDHLVDENGKAIVTEANEWILV